MNAIIGWLNGVSTVWWGQLVPALWQSALVAVVLLAVVGWGRRWPAPWRYGLLVLALAKFAVPPLLPGPTGLFSRVDAPGGVRTPPVVPVGVMRAPVGTLDTPTRLSDPIRPKNTTILLTDPVGETAGDRVKRGELAGRAEAPAGNALGWKAGLLVLQVLGTIGALLWIAGQWLRLRRWVREAEWVTDEPTLSLVRKLADRLQLRQLPDLRLSARVKSPMAVGVLRPTVLLPTAVPNRFPLGGLRTILAHELVHFYRRDLVVNWGQLLLQAVWWFDPVLWVLNRAVRSAREDCCDDLLLARGFTSNRAYCDTLLQAAAEFARPTSMVGALGFGEGMHPLGRRLARIADRSLPRSPRLSALGCVFIAGLAGLLLPGLRSQPSEFADNDSQTLTTTSRFGMTSAPGNHQAQSDSTAPSSDRGADPQSSTSSKTVQPSGDPLSQWTLRNPLPTGNPLFATAYGNHRFVAVGERGTLVTSPDSSTWANLSPATGRTLSGLVYGHNQFVAVGAFGTVLTSPNGVSWTLRSSGTTHNLKAVAYGHGRFVAVGDRLSLTSPDGIHWSKHISGTENNLYDIAYGDGRFVAVGWSGTVVTSSDGLIWTVRQSGTDNTLYSVAYGHRQFVATGRAGVIVSSSDGRIWAERTSATDQDLYHIAYANHRFVAVGQAGVLMVSDNGRTWTRHRAGTPNDLYGITYGNRQFVAVGRVGTIVTSTVGRSWIKRTLGLDAALHRIAYGNHCFAAVGAAIGVSEGVILTSPDGDTWTSRVSENNTFLTCIAYGNDEFVAAAKVYPPDTTGWISTSSARVHLNVGRVTSTNPVLGTKPVSPPDNHRSGQHARQRSRVIGTEPYNAMNPALRTGGRGAFGVWTSPDGREWTKRVADTDVNLHGIAFGNHRFVGVGSEDPILTSTDGRSWTPRASGIILTSTDGRTWTRRVSGRCYSLRDVVHGDNRFVAVGAYGTILSSLDGRNWTARSSGTRASLRGVAYGNHRFVVVGGGDTGGMILTSPDGMTWTSRTTGPIQGLSDVAYGDDLFVAVDDAGMIVTSPDGIKWSRRDSGTSHNLSGVAFGNHSFVVVGGAGTILQSGVVGQESRSN